MLLFWNVFIRANARSQDDGAAGDSKPAIVPQPPLRNLPGTGSEIRRQAHDRERLTPSVEPTPVAGIMGRLFGRSRIPIP
jgi:hypothetical protein